MIIKAVCVQKIMNAVGISRSGAKRCLEDDERYDRNDFCWVCGHFSLAPAAEDLGNEEHGLRRSAQRNREGKRFGAVATPL